MPTKKKPTRGGARKGAGRKLGSGEGRKAMTRSVSMSASQWEKLDELRAGESRGAFIARKLKLK